MHARTSLSAFVAAAVAGSALAITAGPAFAADPDDTTFTPTTVDLIGVGSDTSQHAVKLLADAYNATSPSARLATFAATGEATITLPGGAVPRPNGSGAGKSLLYGAGNNTDVDFARSSSALSTTEAAANLQAFPFALDTLVMTVSNSTPSHAPASLTDQQIVDIYDGTVTNWSQVGGTAGVIAPKIPQNGSGTRSFFLAQLKTMNGGVDVVLAGTVAEVQEHDDTTIKNNANAIAPFSRGRAGLLGTTLRVEGGFAADRALYNVVRQTDLGSPAVQAAFGTDGFVCSVAARPLIEAAGFSQLGSPAVGGVCGVPTQAATSNFTLNEDVPTTTSVTLSSSAAGRGTLVARVSGRTTPRGTVEFFEGATSLRAGVPLVSGQATLPVAGAPGAHTYRAVFTGSAGSVFLTSTGTGAGTIRTSATIKESFPAKVKAGKKAKGVIRVTLTGVAAKATGLVKVLKGSKVLKSKTMKAGKVTIKLPTLKPGKNKLKVVWAGDANGIGDSLSFKIKQLPKKK